MDKEKAIETIKQQLSELSQVDFQSSDDERFQKWQRNTRVIIEKVFGRDARQLEEFSQIYFYGLGIPDEYGGARFESDAYQKGRSRMKAFLESVIYEIEKFSDEEEKAVIHNDSADSLSRIFDRFHSVARQLQSRHQDRPTISIDDEYDVQDLLHALLKIYFDDVRPEEWTPSYAGKSSRMDFLLKKEKLVAAKGIGDQLIIDIRRYAERHDCKNLLCFVYDPDSLIGNPAGLESDLSRTENGLKVLVFVRPKSS